MSERMSEERLEAIDDQWGREDHTRDYPEIDAAHGELIEEVRALWAALAAEKAARERVEKENQQIRKYNERAAASIETAQRYGSAQEKLFAAEKAAREKAEVELRARQAEIHLMLNTDVRAALAAEKAARERAEVERDRAESALDAALIERNRAEARLKAVLDLCKTNHYRGVPSAPMIAEIECAARVEGGA